MSVDRNKIHFQIQPATEKLVGPHLRSQLGKPKQQLLNTLIPVETAMIIVAEVKYARISTSIPTVVMYWPHIIKPKSPIARLFAIKIFVDFFFIFIFGINLPFKKEGKNND